MFRFIQETCWSCRRILGEYVFATFVSTPSRWRSGRNHLGRHTCQLGFAVWTMTLGSSPALENWLRMISLRIFLVLVQPSSTRPAANDSRPHSEDPVSIMMEENVRVLAELHFDRYKLELTSPRNIVVLRFRWINAASVPGGVVAMPAIVYRLRCQTSKICRMSTLDV